MNKKLVALLAAVALAGAAAFFYFRSRRKPHHNKVDITRVGNTSVDQEDSNASMIVMLKAPEMPTPCETAYASMEAEQAAARLRNGRSLFQFVAPKADFLATCQSLPPETQKCMMPRYGRDHADQCRATAPPAEVLKKMFVLARPNTPG